MPKVPGVPEAGLIAADSAPAYACGHCGGHGAWDAFRQQVVCTFCGRPLELPPPPTHTLSDFAFIALLHDRPDSGRDWQPVPVEVRCTTCGAAATYEAHVVGLPCGACGSPTLVPCDATGAPVRPGSLVPFRITPHDAQARLTEWLTARSRRRKRLVLDGVRAVYLPCWAFSAQYECRWRGEYVKRDRDGSETRRPVDGVVERQFEDVTVPASRSVPESLWRSVEPFPLSELLPFDSRYLAGSRVETYAVNMWDAWDAAQSHMQSDVDAELRSATKRVAQLEQWPKWSAERCKHMLLPLYVSTYSHKDQTYQVVMNGCTGTIAGTTLRDVLMETVVVLVLLGVAAGVVYAVVWALRALLA